MSVRNRPTGDVQRSGRLPRGIGATVLALGAVSLVTDVSTESVSSVLPNYLLLVLGLSPQAFGVVNGLYNGVSALVRVLGGWSADRSDRPKWVAFVGYGISAIGKVALLSAHSFGAFSAIASTDQLGKGLRTAPRDAMIVASSEPESLGRAFGVHRAMDTFGAFLGPLLAFWILLVVPGNFHAVFVVAVAFAVVGVATLLLVVPDLRPRRSRVQAGGGAATRRGARASFRLMVTPALIRITVAAALLGLLSIGETYVFLELQGRSDMALTYYPLLVVGMNLAYLVLAVPLGLLADRVGRWPVFIAGYLALAAAYLCAGGPMSGTVITCVCLLLLGGYYAATDGLLAGMAGQATDVEVRSTAIASAQTVVALSSLCSSILFAALWTAIGRTDALLVVAGLLTAAVPVAAWLLRGMAAPAADATAT